MNKAETKDVSSYNMWVITITHNRYSCTKLNYTMFGVAA